jgi:hypothetical protein
MYLLIFWERVRPLNSHPEQILDTPNPAALLAYGYGSQAGIDQETR